MNNVQYDSGFASGYLDELKARINWGIDNLKLSDKKFRVSPVKGNGKFPAFNFTRKTYFLPADRQLFNSMFQDQSISKVLVERHNYSGLSDIKKFDKNEFNMKCHKTT